MIDLCKILRCHCQIANASVMPVQESGVQDDITDAFL